MTNGVYISGPIKGNDDYLEDFEAAEKEVSFFEVIVNPCKLDHPADATYEDFMREDIRAMLDCHSIYLLKGWEQSAGAKVEFLVETACGMSVYYQ